MTLYTHQARNVRRTYFLFGVFFVLIIGLGWLMSQIYQSPAILYGAVILSLAMNGISYWYSDKVALAIAGARPASRQEFFTLYTTVENLAITAGLPLPKIYIIPDDSPNAFATGRNKEHAIVAVTTGLLRILNQTELEGVIAHELAHIGNRDILLSTVVVTLVGVVALLGDFFRRSMFWNGGALARRSSDNRSEGGGILMLLGIVAAILAPLAATLIQLAISRRREFLADASGALLTRYPEGLASALQKIAQVSATVGGLRRASTATAHLFISNPFGPRATRGLTRLFLTHPPVEERIAALRQSA